MSFLDGMRHRWAVWTKRDEYDHDIDEEIRFHLDLDATQQRAASDPVAAARRRFGNVTYAKEETRRAAGLHLFDGLRSDIRHLLRSLRGAPGFGLAATLTLSLGIAVTTVFVSLADHVLVRGFPFADPSRLMMMLERDAHGAYRTPSGPTATDWQTDSATARAVEGVTYIRGDGIPLEVADKSETIGTAFVSPDFFPLLRTRPIIGRLLIDDDHRPDAPPVAVMGNRLWKRHFGGDPAIVGRTINLEGGQITVVGVLPPGAVYPVFAELWTPLWRYQHKQILQQRSFHADSRTLARLRAGVDSVQAVALMRGIGLRLGEEYPADQKGWMPSMVTVQQELVGDVGMMLWTLAGAAAAVLLLACVNVAGLLLVRVTGRTRELAVRTALGASRGRIARQLLTESVVLACLGGIIGTALTAIGIRLAATLYGDRIPRADELGVDLRVLGIAAVATIVTALLCGLWPALRATRQRSIDVLRGGALGSVGLRQESRARRGLIAVQFALALMLLIGAGLLLQSFRRAASTDVGFDPANVMAARIAPPKAYEKAEDAAALYRRLMDATRAVAGVEETAFVSFAPYGGAIYTSLAIEGRPTLDSSNQVFYRTVSDGYLRTMRMRLVAGRWFDANDMRSPGGSFVINQTMARQYWPGTSAIGQRMTVRRSSQARSNFGEPLPGVVVGVVADVKQGRLDAGTSAEVYVPYTLETWPWGYLVMRARDGRRAIPALSRAIAAVDPRLINPDGRGAGEVGPLEDAIKGSLRPRKMSMALIGAFAACALILALIGMYGVVAHGVAQRTREIGVRKALGASDGQIVALFLRESALVVVVGVVLGCAGALRSANLVNDMLFRTAVNDLPAYIGMIVLLAASALVATYIPSRRAMRLDPTIAMRGE